jgi:hypothetical protein
LKSPSIRSSAPGSSILSCSSPDELLSSAGDRLYVERSSKSSTSIVNYSFHFISKSGQADRTGPERSGASHFDRHYSHSLVRLFTRCCGLTSSQHMETRDLHYVSGSESDPDYTHRPPKRARRSSPSDRARTNGRNATSSSVLPPLSLSILGVEPLDEFIREVADFIHHLITTRPADLKGEIEVEAKIGVLKDRGTGNRLQLPILVETSMIFVARNIQKIHRTFQSLLQKLQTATSSLRCLK